MEINLAALYLLNRTGHHLRWLTKNQKRWKTDQGRSRGSVIKAAHEALGMVSWPCVPIPAGRCGTAYMQGKGHLHVSQLLS